MNPSFSASGYQIFKADFLDRIRQRNYLITLMCMVIITLLFFPANDAAYVTVDIGGYRGIYNSEWIGISLAILNAFMLPIICFYLVKNSIEKDRTRGIGDLIAATAMNKSSYIIGKWLSNLAVLTGVMLVMVVTSGFIQLWYGESYLINPIALLLPQLIYVFPVLTVIAAIALLFEAFSLLRGGLGNVGYFFLWVGLMGSALVRESSGIGQVLAQLTQDVNTFDPLNDGSVIVGGTARGDQPLKHFVWSGMDYGREIFSNLAFHLALTLVVLALAILFFDRFKQSSDQPSSPRTQRTTNKLAKITQPLSRLLAMVTAPWAFTRLVRQEFLLLMRGGSVWWYLILIGLWLAQLLAPLEAVRMGILPATWILCVLTFSPLGQREIQQGADQLIFSCPSPIKQQFPAMLVAGFCVAMMVASGAALRFLLESELFSLLMLCSGALFIPSLALACGSLTRTSRTFEVLFTAIWYIGPLQHSPIDFIGVDPVASQQSGAAVAYFVVSLVLIALAIQGRRWQLKR